MVLIKNMVVSGIVNRLVINKIFHIQCLVILYRFCPKLEDKCLTITLAKSGHYRKEPNTVI